MSEYIKELLYKMADDQLIIGHRNSEWTGLGPLLEEDIAFSSMAQDKVGQSQHLYQLLHELGASDPDTVAFTRNAKQFHCCQLVELPIGDYSFSIVRHFLFDFAEALRFEALSNSSFQPLAQVARKFKGEIKYHTLHANTWMQQLGNGNEESKAKMQSALNEAWPYALGIFEKGHFENQLIENKVFFGEEALKQQWLDLVSPLIKKAGLKVPHDTKNTKGIGGRVGIHTEYLQPLLNEMTEVYALDPSADW
mgnify:CR=1 FL=1|tara:strand:+ start:420 stop:1172 length:753 start_codon:yes stop_codon:yes gene_type:complete